MSTPYLLVKKIVQEQHMPKELKSASCCSYKGPKSNPLNYRAISLLFLLNWQMPELSA